MDRHGVIYTRYHNPRAGYTYYVVHHPALSAAGLVPEAWNRGQHWSVSDSFDKTAPEFTAPTRAEAVCQAVQHTKNVLRGRDLKDRVRLMFSVMSIGSTAWQLLAGAVQASDDRVAAGVYKGDSYEYWACAWGLYEQRFDSLTDEDRRLAKAYDLDDLARCAWCLNKLLNPYLLDDEPYHPECAAEAEKETVS